MKEFDCKDSSTIGPKERHDDRYICNYGKFHGTRGSLPDLREDSGRKRCGTIPREEKNWCEWVPKTVEHKIECMEKVMESDGHGVDEIMTTIQNIEFAGNVAHCTKAERERQKIVKRHSHDVRTL